VLDEKATNTSTHIWSRFRVVKIDPIEDERTHPLAHLAHLGQTLLILLLEAMCWRVPSDWIRGSVKRANLRDEMQPILLGMLKRGGALSTE